MSLQVTGRPAASPADEFIDPSYDELAPDPDYDEFNGGDLDYDPAAQGEVADDFADPDYDEAPSQEWYARKQK